MISKDNWNNIGCIFAGLVIGLFYGWIKLNEMRYNK